MPYSVAEFDEARQEAFIESVADALNVQSFRVEITSITEAAGRRLLAQGCEVLFRVRMPRGEEEDRGPLMLEALSAVENMNARLEQRGLQPALRVVPARIVRPQRSCAVSQAALSINGVHGLSRAPHPLLCEAFVLWLDCGYARRCSCPSSTCIGALIPLAPRGSGRCAFGG